MFRLDPPHVEHGFCRHLSWLCRIGLGRREGGTSGMQLIFCISEFYVSMRELSVLSICSYPLMEQLDCKF